MASLLLTGAAVCESNLKLCLADSGVLASMLSSPYRSLTDDVDENDRARVA